MKSQRDDIIDYIREHGSISPMEAFHDLGITKLATRVSEMRKDGIQIYGRMEKVKSRRGRMASFKRYFMEV